MINRVVHYGKGQCQKYTGLIIVFKRKGKLYKMKRGRKDKVTVLARDFKTPASVIGRVGR